MSARRRNSDRVSADSGSFPLPMPCDETGTMLFARTSSGSFEVAKIIKADNFYERFYVLFENGLKRWVPFADMQKRDVTVVLNVCCLCQRKARMPSIPLLRCIVCQLGFHRKCHSPAVGRLEPEEATRWQCQVCIYTTSPDDNDTVFSIPSEEIRSRPLPKAIESSNDVSSDDDDGLLHGPKKLSYSLVSLTWDKNHLTNSENRYCYCGRSGRWDNDMLRCTRCQQWFHRGCISLKTDSLVAGDLLYFFFCSICFKREFYYRLQVTWNDLAHLALYNLSREQSGVDFFDFDWDVVPWVRRHWRKFHAGKLNGMTQLEREKNLLEALEKNPSRFEQSQPPKTSWHLKEKRILTAPDVDLEQFFPLPQGQLELEQFLRTLAAVEEGCGDLEENRAGKRAICSKRPTQKKPKTDTIEPTSSSTAGTKAASVNDRTTPKRTRARKRLLDQMIPVPPSYDGVNHPFKTEIEREDEIKSVECRRKALELAVQKANARFDALAETSQADAKKEEQDGTAGGLFNFNGMDVANRPKRRKSVIKKSVTDLSDCGLDGVTIRCFGERDVMGRVIGRRIVEEGRHRQLLVEWEDGDQT